ncbi:MAG: cyclic pyranopterin monophosphate synthase MoaC [Candidatus Korarchaeum sp.]|nr:cyclic pyranopterin monophosphate synthase MoaC [Candidatus Korarchaeum sp.]MDW8035941.1 cyclic pyranopterin monophosphate synthase MoaC [Candidatus Korarchaeum sp.]
MVDVTDKPEVYREALAKGRIRLRRETIEKVKAEEVKKGDVLTVARVAAVQAVKETSRSILLCHPIQVTSVNVDFSLEDDSIEVRVRVKAFAQTGVEMEALNGVATALLNIWDMVKYLEKDETGNYPFTKIEEICVERKVKSLADRQVGQTS